MAFKNNSYFINDIIISKSDDDFIEKAETQTFLIHSSIYPAVLKCLTRMKVQDLHYLGNYELTVGEYTFDMKMLVIERKSSLYYFKKLVKQSQYTYFWEKKFTLFREVDKYYELEEFIAINDLNKHVISVKEVAGVNTLGVPIKLVTFDDITDKLDLYFNYLNFLRNKFGVRDYSQSFHCYFTHALPWHRPILLDIYRIPLENQRIFLGFQTFLTCMRELTYAREPHLDLISLCSLKLAFCDDRNVTEASRELELEIDALIERFLRRMQRNQTYIKNDNFDIIRYAVDTNSLLSTSYPAVINLIYTFQHIFHCTNFPVFEFRDRDSGLSQTLTLIDENKDLKTLRYRSNIPYGVNAENYNKMNSKLFYELLKCRNVDNIRLDTNYEWTNEPYFINFDDHDSNEVTINLVGSNQFNFIEDFIQFLKTIPISLTSEMKLIIEEVTLKDYNIFKNLKVGYLQFHGSRITFTMLTELLECDLKDIHLNFKKCTIEDQTSTWSLLLNGFDRVNVEVNIFEAESTWQHLFESIANHLTKLKLNQFQFKCHVIIFSVCGISIFVNDINFMLDEFKTRLDMRAYDGTAIDLFYLKNFDQYKEPRGEVSIEATEALHPLQKSLSLK